jgi:hypothetical protein
MKVTRSATSIVPTSATEAPLRSPDQLVPGVILCGGGFNNIWMVVARRDDELDLTSLPLQPNVQPACIRGEHSFKTEGYTFGRRCRSCNFLRTRIVVDQPLGLVVTAGPPAAYVVVPSSPISTPERGVVYSNGTQFFTPSGAAENLVWSKALPIVPDLFVAWQAPAYWRDKL